MKNLDDILCTTKLAQSTSRYYLVLQSLHKVRPSTTSYYKACTSHFPVLLRTTKLAQSTSQYYFVLQSLHKALPSTTLYYTACTKHFPVLLCTKKLAQSTSQYYFVLQSLHKKYFPVLLCTTKLAQSTSQHYFVLQSLRKALPSTTSYYKACIKYVPVLLCTTKLTQNICRLVTYHYRSPDAATPLRFTKSICERQKYLHTQPWRQATWTQPLQSAETELRNAI